MARRSRDADGALAVVVVVAVLGIVSLVASALQSWGGRLALLVIFGGGGRRVTVEGGAGDLQADITALAPDGGRAIVQCKRYAPDNKVGSPAVQSFIGMSTVHHKAAHGLLVTTSSFTGPAQQLAEQHRIELVDGDAFVRRIGQRGQRVTQPASQARPSSPPSTWPATATSPEPSSGPPLPPSAPAPPLPPSPPAPRRPAGPPPGEVWTAREPGRR